MAARNGVFWDKQHLPSVPSGVVASTSDSLHFPSWGGFYIGFLHLISINSTWLIAYLPLELYLIFYYLHMSWFYINNGSFK